MVVVSIILMVLDQRQHHLEGLRGALSTALFPLRSLVNLPVTASNSLQESLASRSYLIEQNQQLRQKQLLLEVRMLKMSAIERENQRLRAILRSTKQEWEKVLVASMIAVDLDPYRHRIKINRGSNDGVFIGHPVLDAQGVVGQIAHVDPFHSDLLLITDPSHSLPVRVVRNGLRAIAIGTGEPTLEIPHIPNNADIEVGDLLVTSGLDLRFPPDYPVAKISHIERNPTETYAHITAEPSAKLQQTEELLLIWPGKRENP